MNIMKVCSSRLCLSRHIYINFTNFSILPDFLYVVDGCTLSNSVIVGVHHISKERLHIELNMRRIPIPIRAKSTSTPRASLLLTGAALVGARVAKYSRVQGRAETLVRGSVSAFTLGNGGSMFTTTYDNGDRCRMNSRELQNAHNLALDEDEWEIYLSKDSRRKKNTNVS
jgi:hypothetical protein